MSKRKFQVTERDLQEALEEEESDTVGSVIFSHSRMKKTKKMEFSNHRSEKKQVRNISSNSKEQETVNNTNSTPTKVSKIKLHSDCWFLVLSFYGFSDSHGSPSDSPERYLQELCNLRLVSKELAEIISKHAETLFKDR